LSLPDAEVSPLELARRASGLTLKEVAARLGSTQAAASRWIAGKREAPLGLYLLLSIPHEQERMEEWRRAHGLLKRRGETRFEITTRLPAGMSIEEARQACLQAIASLREAGR